MIAHARYWKRSLVGGVALGALAAAASAHAQTAPRAADAAPSAVSEVVVTANKRTERLQDVANSVSAISGEVLARTQTLDLQDLATRIPGLSVQSTGGIFTRITIRGLNSGGDGATVATLVDDAPISFSGANTDGAGLASDFDTYDLQRVEVLRGPQGTLYGAASEGGLIKYVTHAPDPTGFHYGIEGGGQTIEHGGEAGSAKGYVNIPLLDGKAAFRATLFYEDLPGFIRNDLLGTKEVNTGERYGGRFSLLYNPTPDLSVRLTTFNQERKLDGQDVLRVFGATDPTRALEPVNGYDYADYTNGASKLKLSVYSLNIDYDFHWARLHSITSYGTVHQSFTGDRPTFSPILVGAFGQPANQVIDRDTHALQKFNQEFRLTSEPDSKLLNYRFDWQVGAFYTEETVDFRQNFEGLTYPGGLPLPAPFFDIASDNAPSAYRDLAGYADGTFHISDALDVEGGVRVARNHQKSQISEGGLLFSGGAPIALPLVNTAETVVTFSAAPRWHITPDILAYFRVASGYRPGGPQFPIIGQPAGVPTSFGPDSTTNYEGGIKGLFFDKRLSVDVAGFYIEWEDIQINQIVNVVNPVTGVSTPYSITGNAGAAISQGVEFTFDYTVMKGLNIGWTGAYTDAHLSETPPAGSAGTKGDKLAYVPEFTSTVSVDYERPLFGDYRGFIGGGWSYTGERMSDLIVGSTQTELPSYNNVYLQLGVRKGPYMVELYGKNLGDERGISQYATTGALGPSTSSSISYGNISIVRPRTLGVRFTADF